MGRIDDLLTLEAAGELPKNMQTDLDTLRSAGEAPPATFTKTAEPPQSKTYGQALQSGLESIIPGAIEGAKAIGKAAITQPEGGFFNIGEAPKQTIQNLIDVAKGAASGATAGIYKPEAPTTEAQAARQTGGQVGGFGLPFTAVSRAAQAGGAVAPWAARLIAGGVTGAAEPLSRGDIPGAIEQGVSGAGQVGLTNAAITAATAPVKAITSTLANRSAAKAAGGATGILKSELAQLTNNMPVEEAGQVLQQAGKTAQKAAGGQMQEARTMVPPDVTVPSSASETIRQALPETGPLRTGTEAKLVKLATDLDPNSQYISPTAANADFRSQVLSALGQGLSNRATPQEVQGYLTRLSQSRAAPPEEAQIVGQPPPTPTPPPAPPPVAELPRINLTRTAEQQAAAAATEPITLFRGELAGQKGEPAYYSPDKEWARQFTQSGLDKEIKSIKLNQDEIYKAPTLPQALKPEQIDATVATAQQLGKKAIWVDEGPKEPNSVFLVPSATIKMGESAGLRGSELPLTAKTAAPTPPPVGASPQGQPARDYLKTQAAAQEPLQPRGQMPVISPAQFRERTSGPGAYRSQAAEALQQQPGQQGLAPEANLGVSFQELVAKRQALNHLYINTGSPADRYLLNMAKNAVDADINKFRTTHPEAVDKYYSGVADYRDKVVPILDITQDAKGFPEYPEKVVEKFFKLSSTPTKEGIAALESSPDGMAALQKTRDAVKTSLQLNATEHGDFNPRKFLSDVAPDKVDTKLKTFLGPEDYAKFDHFRRQLLEVGADKWTEGPVRGGGMWVRMHLVRAAMGLGLGNMFTVASQGGTAGIMYFSPALFQKLANDSRGAKLIAAGMMAGNAPEGSATLNAIAALAKTLGGKEVKDLAAMGIAAENVQRNQQQQEAPAPTQLPPTSGAAFFPPIRRGAPVTAGGSTR